MVWFASTVSHTMANERKIVDKLSTLTVLEAEQLAKLLEEKWGVAASAAVRMSAAPAKTAAAIAAAAESARFSVTLASSGTKIVEVVKEVRAITGLGLKEAKDLVAGAPKVIKEGLSEAEANVAIARIMAVGGSTTVTASFPAGNPPTAKSSAVTPPDTKAEEREILHRIERWAGSTQKARFWYRAEPIPAFGGRTAEALVNEGKAADVRDFLDHIAVGGFA
jgi:large subunit ribosomal protein L7/L12